MKKGFIIAIDGPVAAGKGTIAPMLAEKLHGFYLYTGAMYRCVALYCIEHAVDVAEKQKVIAIAKEIADTIQLINNHVFLEGNNVTEKLKDSNVAKLSSFVAAIPEVRQLMVLRQQNIAKEIAMDGTIVVAEGRDTGTKVFPDAAVKIFLTASPEIRATRRIAQYQEQGKQITYEQILQDTLERDKRDTERETDPLPAQPEKLGYIIINDSTISKDETLEMILEIALSV